MAERIDQPTGPAVRVVADRDDDLRARGHRAFDEEVGVVDCQVDGDGGAAKRPGAVVGVRARWGIRILVRDAQAGTAEPELRIDEQAVWEVVALDATRAPGAVSTARSYPVQRTARPISDALTPHSRYPLPPGVARIRGSLGR